MSNDSNRRPRVLVLTPRYPYPVIGGDRLRIYFVCRELSKTCDLTLLSLCDTKEEFTAALTEDGVFSSVERIYMPAWRSKLNVLKALPTRTPLQVAYYRNQQFRARAQELIATHDVCLAHLIRTGDVVRKAPIPRVLEMTDAVSLNYGRVRSAGSRRDWRTWLYRIEARRVLAYERRALNDFDVVTLVSEVDRDFLLQGCPQSHVLVCSNGVDLSRFPYRFPQQADRSIVFVGDMRTVQNLDACHYFIEQVLPELRTNGDFRFRIIGRISAEMAERFTCNEGVEVKANVPSVPEAIGSAFAAVAPIRLGAGVQNKILEYMALGIPVVTSGIGLEGLRARREEDILVAESPRDYVNLLLKVWSDGDFARCLSRAGRSYVEREHSWGERVAPMIDAIHRLAKCRSQISPGLQNLQRGAA